MRSYGDPCGVARALDVVGERLALLVVRELLLGPKRFTELHRGLGGASQNVLSQRLRELAAAGVLRCRRLGPPTSAWVYELTDWGRDLEPVLLALGGWGSRAPLADPGELGVDALVLALRTTFDPAAAPGLPIEVELRFLGERAGVRIDGNAELAAAFLAAFPRPVPAA
jgi:DNA-binding HxlR family transcriptional regulator